MQKNILVTGLPRSGKSTLLKQVIGDTPNKTGFVAEELRENDERVGFGIETNKGQKITLAHVEFETPHKVSKYGLSVENLETVVNAVWNFDTDDILYLDEIGQMQLFSEKFKGLVLRYLNSENIFLVSISKIYHDEFIENLLDRDDIILVEITPDNREQKLILIKQLIRKLIKAKKYITEPERFTFIDPAHAEMHSTHATRHLKFASSGWLCDCDFYQRFNVCSHSIAVAALKK